MSGTPTYPHPGIALVGPLYAQFRCAGRFGTGRRQHAPGDVEYQRGSGFDGIVLTWYPRNFQAVEGARNLLSTAFYLHATFKDEVWLWRGQADARYGVESAIHTRVLRADGFQPSEDLVTRSTVHLLETARTLRFDEHPRGRLTDLALLAYLQHHGAATPLLDVTTDPLIALWMVAFADSQNPDRLDSTPGRLFGILKPPRERWLEAMDARPYVGREGMLGIAEGLDEGAYYWFNPPDVTERLRIQRGSFLLGRIRLIDGQPDATLNIDVGAEDPYINDKSWIERRIEQRGHKGKPVKRRSELFAFMVPGEWKAALRSLLIERSGLDVTTVYPTAWEQPHLAQFAQAYGRGRPLTLDLAPN